MRFNIKTLGCKVNQYETHAIEKILIERGHTPVSPGEGCDLCIINTCAVTEESVRKSKQAIRRMKKLEPDALITVCGCYSQLDQKEVAKLGVDLISGASDRELFALQVEKLKTSRSLTIDNELSSIFEELQPGSTMNRTRALLKIQDGCDNYCTYCIVPYARGRSRSLSLDRMEEYAKQLEEQGYKEIIITGIEISSYGRDIIPLSSSPFSLLPSPGLINAIRIIQCAAPDVRLRLGSLDPIIMTDEFCAKLSEIPTMCHHFHLSLQSGCDETLQRMGRKYDTNRVLHAIYSLRNHFSNCGITADLITGFPGETDDEFDQTLKFIKNAAFSAMHIFPYSPRPGTKAADMPGQIIKSIKKERARIAIETANALTQNFKQNQIGRTARVLFEKEKNGISAGHSENNMEIYVKGKIDRNTIHNTRIISINNGLLMGEIV